jgi:hypothetical protein
VQKSLERFLEAKTGIVVALLLATVKNEDRRLESNVDVLQRKFWANGVKGL